MVNVRASFNKAIKAAAMGVAAEVPAPMKTEPPLMVNNLEPTAEKSGYPLLAALKYWAGGMNKLGVRKYCCTKAA